MKTHSAFLLIAAVLGNAFATATHAADQYVVRYMSPGVVDVEACFNDDPPPRLYRHDDAYRYTEWVRHDGDDWPGGNGKRSLNTSTLASADCLAWRVDLAAAANDNDDRTAMRVGEDVVSATRLWFWRGGGGRDIEVTFELPDGFGVSVPWTPMDGSNRYRPAPTSARWRSRSAFGRFTERRLKLPGGDVRIAVVGGLPDTKSEKLIAWMAHAARSVSLAHGRFPQADAQALVVPIGPRRSAVPWAHVMRGGGVSAEFFVDENASLATLQRDWTAVHEFSHMLIPYVSSRDRWLSEGLASYYQNVLMARAGDLSEQEAWQKLDAGFERGRRGTHGGTLAEATRAGWSNTMRVYWSGAAMMLKADTDLRARGDGQSLDTVLGELAECCLDPARSWRARDLLAEMDRISGTEIFSALFDAHVHDEAFPVMTDTYDGLGIEPGNDIQLEDDARLAPVRRAIMAGGASARALSP